MHARSSMPEKASKHVLPETAMDMIRVYLGTVVCHFQYHRVGLGVLIQNFMRFT